MQRLPISAGIAIALGLLVAMFSVQCTYSQSIFGSIVGTVTDSTGAVVPEASISLTNLATADVRTAKADAVGNYRLLNLPPGQYKEDVELAGFKHFTRQPITVEVGSTIRIDIPMALGEANEIVTVSAETPLLQADNPSLGQVVPPKTVQEMPLNGRNVLNLLALTPGVIPQTGTSGTTAANGGTGLTNLQGWNNFQIGGGLTGQGASFYDGAPVNSLGGNVVQLVLTQDMVNEFRVASNSVSAEFGRFGGGVINYTTKSGANEFHGSAYEYVRNTVLNADTFWGKRTAQPKAPYKQNQYGGTFGGPIKRQKAFFFGSYEQYKVISGRTVLTNVPTAAEKTGDFSADKTIYDPLTTQVVGGVVTRTAFTGNKIPSTRFDAAANAMTNTLKYFPDPNTSQAGGNYAATRMPGSSDKQGTIRVDANISDKQHLFARYTYWSAVDTPLNTFGNLTGAAGAVQKTHNGVLGDTYSLSSNTTLDLRLSVLRGYAADDNHNVGQDLSVFGPAWATLGSQVSQRQLPRPGISGLFAFTGMPNISGQYRDSAAIAPSLMTIKGRHTLKFGADLRLLDFNYFQATSASGQFNFDNSFTSANATTSSPTGMAFASFLLGYPASGFITTIHAAGQFSRYQAYYATDTWQVVRHLTLSLGARWEIPGAFMERHNLATVLDPNAKSPLGTSYKGGLALVNSPTWAPRSTEQVKHNLFAPRIGVSYNPISSTVVSFGYGINYFPHDLYDGAMPFLSPINSSVTNMVTSVGGAGRVPLNTLANPFPLNGVTGTTQQSIVQPPGRSAAYLDSLNGLSITGPITNVRFGYAQQWNASIQQQIYSGALVTLAYAGTRGTFLPLGSNTDVGSVNNLNQLPNQYQSMGTALKTTVTNPLAGLVNPTGSLNGATVITGQLLRPFPQYTNVIQANAKGDNIYHALQVSLQKRFAGGGVLSSNYTWAKNIGNASGSTKIDGSGGQLQDFTNPRGDRAVLAYDVRQRFVTSVVHALPFGHGQRYLSNPSKVVGGFVSGWQMSGIFTFQAGFPLALTSLNNSLSTSFGAGTIRPNLVAGCNPKISGSAQDRLSKWFDTSCYVAPGDYSFGNVPMVEGGLRTSGVANYDLSANKSTGITEKLHLELRVELFNLFNRVQFGAPGTQRGNSTFGAVSSAANQPRQMQIAARLVF